MMYSVKELIEELQKFDPDKTIHIAWGEADGVDIEKIEETNAAVFLVNYSDADFF